jgi:hypothetical protein
MNEAEGDAPLTADQERAEALATLSSGEDRMNTEGAMQVLDNNTPIVVTYDQEQDQQDASMNSAAFPTSSMSEDDRDNNASMDTTEMNAPSSSSKLVMTASSVHQTDEPSAFVTMNTLKVYNFLLSHI